MHMSKAKRILVVDDEECIADTLALILRSSGYEVTARTDARSALEDCALRIPDLVLSDVMMPEMNGIELAIQVEQRYPTCKVLLISGLGSSFGLAAEAAERGHSFEILSKPIRPAELLARIEAALTDGDLVTDLQSGVAAGEHSSILSVRSQGDIRDRKFGT